MFFNKKSYSSRESGNVFFFIILGIVLFGALSYTVVNTSDTGSTSLLTENKAKISQGEIDSYYADVRAGITQLQLDGCSTIDFTRPQDQVAGNKSCHLFHADGAAVSYKDIGIGEVKGDLTLLEIGENLNGVVYAGMHSGHRIYTTAENLTGLYTYNNGSGSPFTTTGFNDADDGLTNTNSLVAATADPDGPYEAAVACRALGASWYLPSINELSLLYNNRLVIGNFPTDTASGEYWSSTEFDNNQSRTIHFTTGASTPSPLKNQDLNVRCTRRD